MYSKCNATVSAQNLTMLFLNDPLTRERASWFDRRRRETRLEYLELPVPGNWHWRGGPGAEKKRRPLREIRTRVAIDPLFSRPGLLDRARTVQRENGLECKVTSNLQLRPLLRPFRCLWSGCLNYGPEAPGLSIGAVHDTHPGAGVALNARWPRY